MHTYVTAFNDESYSWTAPLSNILHGFVYLNDSTSRGEVAIGLYLKHLGFVKQYNNKQLPTLNHFVHSYVFHHCAYRSKLHADFIVNVNHHYIVIEYDGYQHFAPVSIMGGVKGLFSRRYRDIDKNNYCFRTPHLTLIRIGDFWSLDTMRKIKHLVKFSMNNEFKPLVRLYSNNKTNQLSLF